MARTKTNLLLEGLKGALGKQLVVKQYANGKIVVTQYPDMEGIKRSRLQKKNNGQFKEAVRYAQSINNDPVAKAAYKATLAPGKDVYHAAIQEYYDKH